ncbi:hypothetical protein GQR58_029798 [Nymphon striatum]|nr:hypothetical protein GQR58_029798 [Nymphon striatum]
MRVVIAVLALTGAHHRLSGQRARPGAPNGNGDRGNSNGAADSNGGGNADSRGCRGGWRIRRRCVAVRAGAPSALLPVEPCGPSTALVPIAAGSLIDVGPQGEARVDVQGCGSIYVFEQGQLRLSGCRRQDLGSTACAVTGTSAFQSSGCDELITIQTVSAEIVTTGTWFTVTVDPKTDLTLVTVLEGSVEVTPFDEAGDRTSIVVEEREFLQAGEFYFTTPEVVVRVEGSPLDSNLVQGLSLAVPWQDLIDDQRGVGCHRRGPDPRRCRSARSVFDAEVGVKLLSAIPEARSLQFTLEGAETNLQLAEQVQLSLQAVDFEYELGFQQFNLDGPVVMLEDE